MKNKYLILSLFLVGFLMLSSIVSAAVYVDEKGRDKCVFSNKLQCIKIIRVCVNGDYRLVNTGHPPYAGFEVCRGGRWVYGGEWEGPVP